MEKSFFNESSLKKYLTNDLDVTCFSVIDSTNTYARNHLNDYSKDFLVVANQQTGGRGRTGKSFYSPDHGFYFTFTKKNVTDIDLTLITIKAALATSNALKKTYQIDTSIKWVNDIYYNHFKCCGILCELVDNSLIVGIGININQTLPDFLNNIAISIPIDHFDCNLLAAALADEFISLFHLDNSSAITLYKNKLILLNKKISFTINNITYEGIVKDINEYGNLIVQTADTIMTLKSGEVSLISKRID